MINLEYPSANLTALPEEVEGHTRLLRRKNVLILSVGGFFDCQYLTFQFEVDATSSIYVTTMNF